MRIVECITCAKWKDEDVVYADGECHRCRSEREGRVKMDERMDSLKQQRAAFAAQLSGCNPDDPMESKGVMLIRMWREAIEGLSAYEQHNLRQCEDCGVVQPRKEFRRRGNAPDHVVCKACRPAWRARKVYWERKEERVKNEEKAATTLAARDAVAKKIARRVWNERSQANRQAIKRMRDRESKGGKVAAETWARRTAIAEYYKEIRRMMEADIEDGVFVHPSYYFNQDDVRRRMLGGVKGIAGVKV